ncbi:hypothetical protein ACYEXS_19695 [Paenibacillus sp. MAH-36]|uniref:Phage portal protein n=1 Tax=Paenibacillus violae TaxID=3077234 RepID=A0ABU3R7E1_9BACL|nr:hypothetical protein [Paenibacillus sp. PFR10]MDU0200167.1 hypothetical protein [Paenibacillus sp. PFR10]
MDIMFSVNNFADSLLLPVNPVDEFKAGMNERNNEEFETINKGTLKLLGLRKLKTISIESFFPVRQYAFTKGNRSGWDCVQWFNTYVNQRIPMRLIITAGNVEMMNIPIAIDGFVYGVDRAGDIPYTLTISEFRFGDGTE